ncbi:MAG: hypothetical protein HKM93_07065 [Desulfobacteraceae bacterium]|nr:hypothetical protein [Desulfobacteraceae bacterium]
MLEISCGRIKQKGFLFINGGVLFDAECGSLFGLGAAKEMIKWVDVEILIRELPKSKMVRKIDESLTSLILLVLGEEKTAFVPDESASEMEIYDIDLNMDKNGEDNEKQSNTKQETTMDVQKLHETIEVLKKDVGDGLLATDIFGAADGQSIAGHNTQPKASALFNKLTDFITDALTGSGFPALGKYYIMDLVDGNMVIVIPMGSYRWGMLVNGEKTQMGLLLNIVIPKIIDGFEEAITG